MVNIVMYEGPTRFFRNIEDDCSRRDFTMNSLYLDSNGIIVDHFELVLRIFLIR